MRIPAGVAAEAFILDSFRFQRRKFFRKEPGFTWDWGYFCPEEILSDLAFEVEKGSRPFPGAPLAVHSHYGRRERGVRERGAGRPEVLEGVEFHGRKRRLRRASVLYDLPAKERDLAPPKPGPHCSRRGPRGSVHPA